MGRILAVDDDALARAVLADALRALGHTSSGAGSAAQALALLDAGKFDLVISEANLPDLAGVELAARCAGRAVPVPVAITSASRPDLTGAASVGFLPKPIDPDRLGRFLDTFYATKRAQPAGAAGERWNSLGFLEQVSGPLERFPPIRLLFLVHRLGASGSLTVARGGVIALVGLRVGKVVQVSGIQGLLGTLRPSVPDTCDLSVDLGVAVGKGHAPDAVFQAAVEGLGLWLAGMVDSTGGSVTFDTTWTPPPGSFPLPESLPRLVARGLARVRSDTVVARTWDTLGASGIRRRLPDDASDSSWGLDAAAMRVLRVAGRAGTVERVLAIAAPSATLVSGHEGGNRRVDVLRALDTLRILGVLVIDGAPVEPARAAPAPAPAEPTEEDSRSDRLTKALLELNGAHPLVVLELSERRVVTEEDISNAFREISRRYHPDYFFNAPPTVRDLAEACFAKVSDAYGVLRAPGGLAEARRYLEARSRGEGFVGEKEHVAARLAFRRAEQLLRARDHAGADPFFQEAARLDGITWPHAVLAAWCGWLARRLTAADALAAFDAIRPPDDVRAAEVLVYAGNVLAQEGRAAEALARYRAAVAKDPQNRDALRQIRLHELRNPPKPAPTGIGGLLGRVKKA